MIEVTISIFSLLLSITAILVAYYSFSRTHQTSIQPMLVFINEGIDESRVGFWFIDNVGNGPALNVVIAGGNMEMNWNKNEITLLTAIGCGNKKRLGFIKWTGALLAIYSDAFGNEYTSICVRNRNNIQEGNKYPFLKPKRYQYQLNKSDFN